ncbi:MAG: hypothetical protein GX971_04390 [Firmicutes bacterium]|nr:hypothetical protein [Bacillota bacterium]
MGLRNVCCRCPESWANFINEWVYIVLDNDDQVLFDTQWQLRQVQETYLVFRRPVADLDGFQRAIIPCQHIVALVQAPPPPLING